MAPHKTITINGRLYDAVTGMPLEDSKEKSSKSTAQKTSTSPAAHKSESAKSTPARAVHAQVQRSKTLMRRATKKPASANVASSTLRPKPGRHMDFARSPQVSRFAPHPTNKTNPSATADEPIAPANSHPTVEKALATKTPKHPRTPIAQKPPKGAAVRTAKQVKEAEISKALHTPRTKTAASKGSLWRNKWVRRGAIVASAFILIGGISYLVYQFIPSVSVSFAAAQAGVEASYPEYTPDGYGLKQPVTYSDGQVTLTFASHSNDTTYTITQKRSSWDSTAVLDSLVKTTAGNDYTTTRERGLTLYTYGTRAAWVNSGILYTIEGSAALSGDQVRRIATSM